jgi:hypothetical protein
MRLQVVSRGVSLHAGLQRARTYTTTPVLLPKRLGKILPLSERCGQWAPISRKHPCGKVLTTRVPSAPDAFTALHSSASS